MHCSKREHVYAFLLTKYQSDTLLLFLLSLSISPGSGRCFLRRRSRRPLGSRLLSPGGFLGFCLFLCCHEYLLLLLYDKMSDDRNETRCETVNGKALEVLLSHNHQHRADADVTNHA